LPVGGDEREGVWPSVPSVRDRTASASLTDCGKPATSWSAARDQFVRRASQGGLKFQERREVDIRLQLCAELLPVQTGTAATSRSAGLPWQGRTRARRRQGSHRDHDLRVPRPRDHLNRAVAPDGDADRQPAELGSERPWHRSSSRLQAAHARWVRFSTRASTRTARSTATGTSRTRDLPPTRGSSRTFRSRRRQPKAVEFGRPRP